MTTAQQPGTDYLVGAGPGDPELLTVKAERLLSRCDALVYDSLVPKEVLDLVPEGCERQFVGKRRATIANALRLLTLGEPARDALAKGLIDKGHARALLALNDRETQDLALTRCVKEGWSVRATENFAKKQKTQSSGASDSTKQPPKRKPEDYAALSAAIGLEVNLSGRKITLSAKNREEAHLFLARLTRMVRGTQGIDQKELS